jgi:lipoate-protein ligase A
VSKDSEVRLVLGRHQDPERELFCARARSDRVSIHRRIAGGGAVVLAPGSLVVAIRLPREEWGTDCYFTRVNDALAPAVEELLGHRPRCRGHGDLVLDEGGVERKILGASMRQTRGQVVYLGVFLIADLAPLMERYLRMPSKALDYRDGRGHGAFCTHLDRYGVSAEALREATLAQCRSRLASATR